MSFVPLCLLAAAVYGLNRWAAFMDRAERREIELQAADDLWEDVAEAARRTAMN